MSSLLFEKIHQHRQCYLNKYKCTCYCLAFQLPSIQIAVITDTFDHLRTNILFAFKINMILTLLFWVSTFLSNIFMPRLGMDFPGSFYKLVNVIAGLEFSVLFCSSWPRFAEPNSGHNITIFMDSCSEECLHIHAIVTAFV